MSHETSLKARIREMDADELEQFVIEQGAGFQSENPDLAGYVQRQYLYLTGKDIQIIAALKLNR